MIDAARRALGDPALSRRLAALAAVAPASSPVSMTLPLGNGQNDWLGAVPEKGPWWYLANPEQGRWTLGLGAALEYTSAGPGRFAALHNAAAGLFAVSRGDLAPRLFFGFSFAPESHDAPSARLVLPALLLDCRAGSCTLTVTGLAPRACEIAAGAAKLLDHPDTRPAVPVVRLPRELPDRAWLARVRAALRAIAAGKAEKLVLARSAQLSGERDIPPGPVLAALLARQPSCLTYAVGEGAEVFLGSTPESLVLFRAGIAQADALAGTAWTAGGDAGSETLECDKNRREQAHVVAAVAAALADLCPEGVRALPDEVLRLEHLSHRRTRLEGRPRPGTSLFDLIAALHPTPAVGGHPRAAALDWLRSHGEERPAWYSGGIGEISADGDGEVAVALRCAQLIGREARLWAGAGIVAGSEPERELAETEVKLRTLVDALCSPPVAARGSSRSMAREA
ncbi:MAG TPA: isochorismate synthase [Rhodocyclaceae bacterium]|jgi:isochorismate synthase|nr:isochorismate synthase [Rhodocyclaceae bacterium]HNE43533.1 isochorismate synthase [Rhodocyclaceae bacterium]HNM22679.1 isochorismate synthase [Rhodocyclaceae bacterium]HNM79568.1 isochorismate synthase [Rhodocyclaceae bacterium]